MFFSSANGAGRQNQTEPVMTQINLTKIVLADRNARRRAAYAAKKAQKPVFVPLNEVISDEAAALLGWKNQADHDREAAAKQEVKSERGRTTAFIAQKMQQEGGCTREEIITGLQAMFPEKELSAIKNTVGALMHTIPAKMGWNVNREVIDPSDKRKVRYTIAA
jgi:hypothetical protein